jgi:hypothetical protein
MGFRELWMLARLQGVKLARVQAPAGGLDS